MFLKRCKITNRRANNRKPIFYFVNLEGDNNPIECFNSQLLAHFLNERDTMAVPDPKKSIIWVEHFTQDNSKKLFDESTKTHISKKASDESIKGGKVQVDRNSSKKILWAFY